MNTHVLIRSRDDDLWFLEYGCGRTADKDNAHHWNRFDAEQFLKRWPNSGLEIFEIDTVESLQKELAGAREVLTEYDKVVDGLRAQNSELRKSGNAYLERARTAERELADLVTRIGFALKRAA